MTEDCTCRKDGEPLFQQKTFRREFLCKNQSKKTSETLNSIQKRPMTCPIRLICLILKGDGLAKDEHELRGWLQLYSHVLSYYKSLSEIFF